MREAEPRPKSRQKSAFQDDAPPAEAIPPRASERRAAPARSYIVMKPLLFACLVSLSACTPPSASASPATTIVPARAPARILLGQIPTTSSYRVIACALGTR